MMYCSGGKLICKELGEGVTECVCQYDGSFAWWFLLTVVVIIAGFALLAWWASR